VQALFRLIDLVKANEYDVGCPLLDVNDPQHIL
jgi:hypothetical protein